MFVSYKTSGVFFYNKTKIKTIASLMFIDRIGRRIGHEKTYKMFRAGAGAPETKAIKRVEA